MSTGPSGLVFRDGSRRRSQSALVRDVEEDLAAWRPGQGNTHAGVRALLSASALECALADARGPLAARAAALVDAIAGGLFGARSSAFPSLHAWRSEVFLSVSAPEGFAYYALDPVAFGAAAAAAVRTGRACVVGIRTIGTALSATTRAALSQRGVTTTRFTVRPGGHPYDRRLTLDEGARAEVRRMGESATFVVVDEGPGFSGSSLLATAEALVDAGAPAARVLLVGTRSVDPDGLAAPDGARRWRRFASVAAAPGVASPPGATDLSAGAWRSVVLGQTGRWPPSWSAFERAKAVVDEVDGRTMHKFEGLGRHGDVVHGRACALADAGWTPAPLSPPDARGVVPYPFIDARPLTAGEATPEVAVELGRYIGERASLFAAAKVDVVPAAGEAGLAALQSMLATNLALEVGPREVPTLELGRPVLADGRMHPHEWLRAPTGRLVKVDAVSHGDDHFFPGAVDAAWDLAGAIVEWRLPPGCRTALLATYQRTSGDDVRDRLPAYELAYAAFRARYAAMAAHASDPMEAARWRRAQLRYRSVLRAATRGVRRGER